MKLNYNFVLFWAFACTAIPPEMFKPWTNQSVEYIGNDPSIRNHSHYFENQHDLNPSKISCR